MLQAAAETGLSSLKEQLARMTEVHGQLEEAVKALQGKVDLKDQEIEVLNMELLAKDKVAALQQAIRDQMALQMPLPQVSKINLFSSSANRQHKSIQIVCACLALTQQLPDSILVVLYSRRITCIAGWLYKHHLTGSICNGKLRNSMLFPLLDCRTCSIANLSFALESAQ